MKKKNAHNEPKSNNAGRPRRTATFWAAFSSINKAFAVVQKYLAGDVFVCYYPPVARKGPFQASQYLNEVVLRDGNGSIRLSPGHAHFCW